MESLFTSVIPEHRSKCDGAGLVHSTVNISALFPSSVHQSSLYLPKSTAEKGREYKIMNQITKNSQEASRGI